MGAVADKPVPEIRSFPVSRPAPSNPFPVGPPRELPINYKLIEAIKKRDIILLKKAVQQYQVKPTEFIGPTEQAKTVLHKLAEYNFSEGMAFFLDELSSQKASHISRILNMKDIDGNTPLLCCCLSDAVDTLEVLAKNEYVDVEAKNFAKKTALEIAMEMESSCINVLTSMSASAIVTKATLKSYSDKEDESPLDGQNTATSLDCRALSTSSSNTIKDRQSSQDLQETSAGCAGNRKLSQILADLKTKDTEFIDIEFPHETYYLEDEEDSLIRRYPKLTWSRPCKFLGLGFKTTAVFDHFMLNNVSKSPLVGCEIYSALAAMAEFPQRLSRVFNIKEVNKQGLYSVNLTVAGVPIEIFLDDYFPSIDGVSLLYSKSVSNELWFLLLEKAFAKLDEVYKSLESVGRLCALELLTGMPVVQRPIKDIEEEKLWAKLMDYDKKNYIVCAGETRKQCNAYKNRIFTMVSIAEVNQYKLVKLRNHYGDYTWQGDFCHGSLLWTKELVEQVGYCSSDTSCFYMELKDFMKEFDFLTVCHYHDTWVHNRLNVKCQPNHPTHFELNIEKELEAYISVHQKSPQFVDEGYDYNFSPVEIILAKDLGDSGLESIAFGEHDAFLGKSAVYIHESHKVKLQAGKYLIYVKVNWTDNKVHEFFLNVFSSLPTKVTQIPVSEKVNFLEKVYLNAGTASKEKFGLMNDCFLSSGWSGSHMWIYVCNNGSKTWHLEITFEKMRSLKLGKKFRTLPNVLKFVVPPNQKAAAYAKRTSPALVSVGWQFNQHWE